MVVARMSTVTNAGGQVTKALKDAQDCVVLRPEWAKAHMREASAWIELGKVKGAQPKMLGRLLLGLHGHAVQIDEAVAALRRANECEAGNAEIVGLLRKVSTLAPYSTSGRFGTGEVSVVAARRRLCKA
jgi:hypothetical protein